VSGLSAIVAAMSAREVVAAYWAAVEARDWETLGSLVAEDVRYEVPQTRERVRGRLAYVRFNADGFPGDWHVEVERITGGERDAASVIQFSAAGETQPGVSFFDLGADGLITGITDFWPDPYEPPASRAALTERY
jgi:SnoaL-like domain